MPGCACKGLLTISRADRRRKPAGSERTKPTRRAGCWGELPSVEPAEMADARSRTPRHTNRSETVSELPVRIVGLTVRLTILTFHGDHQDSSRFFGLIRRGIRCILTWLNTNRVKEMARVSVRQNSERGSHPAAMTPRERRQSRLLRHSHIFASVMREVLEVKFLREVTPYTLTLSHFHLLKVITINGDHQVGEVATFLGVSPPAATKSIDKLERLGLIVRTPSKGDRRATMLSPSAKGRRLVQKYEELKAERLSPVLAEFKREEQDLLADLLERFSLSVIRREESSGGLCLRCAAYRDVDCAVGLLRGGCPYQKSRGGRAAASAAKEA